MQRFIYTITAVLFFVFPTFVEAAGESSTSVFFTAPNMVMAKISPNGETIAVLNLVDKKQQLVAVDTKTNIQTELIDLKSLNKGKSSIASLIWLDDDHIAAQLVENKKGIENLLNTKTSRRLIIVKKAKDNTLAKIYTVKTNGWIVHALPKNKNEFLYAKSGIYSKVYSLKINELNEEGKKLNKLSRVDGGQFKKSNEVAEIDGFATRWFFDKNGQPKATLHYGKEQRLQLSTIREENSKEILHSWPKDLENDETAKKLIPIAITNKDSVFYCLDLNELDTRSIYKVDFRSGEEALVYESNSFKIVDVELSANAETISSVKAVNNGRIETIFVEVNNQSIREDDNTKKGFETEISKSLDGHISVIYTESHADSGSFYIKTKAREEERQTLLGKKFPHLTTQLSSELIESTLQVEGVKIPYLLNLPKLDGKKAPLIVMPHGGPIGPYDTPYYNPIVQNFNANGFAVLRVNFRGSGGYSKHLKDSGKKQWGKLMLEDIHQATLLVLKRSDLATSQVCIFGMSYGGYAAMMLAIKYPDIYKCAASWAGVSDINLFLNGSGHTEKQKRWAREHIGDSELDYASLKLESPAYQVSTITTPLLVAHGSKDEVVDVEHAYRMKAMLDKHQKKFQWYLDDEASHSFGELQNKKAFFDTLLNFIEEHIQ